MIRPDQIPDEAVEAAAKELARLNCDEWWTLYMRRARAAIAAALEAWPGAEREVYANAEEGIFLPLTEASDE